ncbi:hypothetical protein [Candidatus Aalborgicola defluviihabitans]|uniref:hypothetical protein n=1 Tax=Candidatus Aalborgicola defluviihabitans TaxID=3386187 RepID=UPI001E015918|nr:hypothetical protein [Burkholderiales bacterium]
MNPQKYEKLASLVDDQEIEFLDLHRNAPKPSPDCLYGIVGDVARAGSENTEVNPYALAAAFMTYVGVSIGRGPYKQIGDDWHHTNLFAVHVGRSSLGRGRRKNL